MRLGYCDTVPNLRDEVDEGFFAYGFGFFPIHSSATQIRWPCSFCSWP